MILGYTKRNKATNYQHIYNLWELRHFHAMNLIKNLTKSKLKAV